MLQRGWRAGLVAAAVIVLPPASAGAHPHVWVKIETEVLADAGQRVSGLRHSWTFDEFYSAFATQGLDKNKDGKLDEKELAPLAEVNITSLKEFDYFTFVKVDGQDAKLLEPAPDYRLEHRDGVLTLHFTLPLAQPSDPRKAKLQYSVYDPTFYIDFSYAKDSPVHLAKSAPAGCRAVVAQPPQRPDATALSEAFYQGLGAASDYGRQFSRDVVIACDAR